VKIQVHAGGRGEAGGVKFGQNPEEIVRLAEQMIGMKVINQQTGPQGIVGEKVMISAPVAIKKEYYIAATIDRSKGWPIILVSKEGGVKIEETAHSKPQALLQVPIQLNGKVRSYHLLELIKFLEWEKEMRDEGMKLLANLAQAFIETDSSLFEINPLVLTQDGHLVALDAKFSIDDDALYRQPAIAQWYDPTQYSLNEVKAREFNISYIGLDGTIGCLVNGAGLAMATMDIIRFYGGSPANFLDVGGSATKEEIGHGFKILLNDPSVKSIFVNIFGGIMDCGLLAQGLVEASQEEHLHVPLIVRMEGTNVEAGKKILRESGLKIITAETMADGAMQAVKVAQGA
jgi:succinyl-CoA synthetase beta subunit